MDEAASKAYLGERGARPLSFRMRQSMGTGDTSKRGIWVTPSGGTGA